MTDREAAAGLVDYQMLDAKNCVRTLTEAAHFMRQAEAGDDADLCERAAAHITDLTARLARAEAERDALRLELASGATTSTANQHNWRRAARAFIDRAKES